jgi:PGF-pre-PGF domain-containing protein
MEINGDPVPFTAVDISGGYRIRYNTPTSYQGGKYNVHATALTTKGQAFSYGWDFSVKPVITTFKIEGFDPVVSGMISEETKTISMVVPYGTQVKAVIPTIVHNGLSISPAADVAQDFTSPVTYTVTAADKTAQRYTVTLTMTANPAKSITSFKFAGLDPAVAGVVSEASKTVTMKVPQGTDVTSLVPTIEYTGMSISPGTGVTQNFKSPITYTVTAADSTTQRYTVTVTIVANSARSITGFKFTELDPVVTGVIDERSQTVSLKVPYGTNITALVPAIEHTGAGISPETGVAQNFTKPVSYTIMAPDGTTQGYTVTVIVATDTENVPVPTSTGGGGGGSGGGGSTGEKAENIELKDVSSIFVSKDLVRFDFKNPGSDIQYIEYISLKNSGTITATIEVLKDRSYFASSSPEGIVYRHVNIWLGKSGYATEANIRDSVIVFRVDNKWVANYNIDPASIALNRYSDGAWSELPTDQTGSDENYLYYKTETSGFSPFAITGKSLLNESTLHGTSDTLFSTSSDDNVIDAAYPIDTKVNETQAERTLPALPATITLLIVSFVCFLMRKQ